MTAKPNVLTELGHLLIQAQIRKTAAASQTVQAQDAATVETPVNQKANGQGNRTMRRHPEQARG